MSANAPQASTTTWKIDPVHTTAEFKVRHMMITNVKGQFTGINGQINFHVCYSEEAARAFFTDEFLGRVTDLYGVRPSVEFVQIATLVEN